MSSSASDDIYLDHAASTPMRPEAVSAMQPYLAEVYGNPSGGHRASARSKTALEAARESVADLLGARPDEIVFTGGGSEADNLAVKGAAWAASVHGRSDVITSAIEHKAVLGAAGRVAASGARVVEVPAGDDGIVDLDRIAAALDERVAVVSIMTVNNETGVVQPLGEIAALVRDRSPHAAIHTDAVQAPQWLDVASVAADVDMIALSGHKFGGPKGVGVLVVRKGTEVVPLIEGGGHEWSLRAGTQNVAGIVAFAAALEATAQLRSAEVARIAALRDRLALELHARVPAMMINGDVGRRVAGILHVAFPGVEAEVLLTALDQAGVYAASGSACSSGAIDPSHVLTGMGLERDRALASVRFSLGWASTESEITRAVPIIAACVDQLNSGS
jgi:cysteine desulfurase